jgi:hypothetical protein
LWKHRFNAPITLPGITIAKKLCFLVIFKIFQDLYLCLYLDIYQLKCFLFHQIYEIWKTKIKKMSITGCPSRKFKKHIKLIWEKVNKNSNIWKKQNEEESCVWCFDKKNKVEWDVLLPLSSLWNTLFFKKTQNPNFWKKCYSKLFFCEK